MPNFLGYVLGLWVLFYVMNWDMKIVFVLFGIYLLFEFANYLMKNFGFVSKEKYLAVVKALKEEKAKVVMLAALANKENEAEQEIKRLIDEYGENYELNIKISGQNAVFSAFLYDKNKFMHHLNIYVNNQRQNRQQPNSAPDINWRKVLGVDNSSSYEEVKSAYRNLSKKYHPDRPGGSAEKMSEINRAWDEAEKSFKNA